MPFLINHKNTHIHHRTALLDALRKIESEKDFSLIRVVLSTKNMIKSAFNLIIFRYPSIICIVGFGRIYTDFGFLGKLFFWSIVKLIDLRSAIGFIVENDEDYTILKKVVRTPVYFTHGSGLDPSGFEIKKDVKNKRPCIGYLSRFGRSKCSDQVLKAAKKLPTDRELLIAGWDISGNKYRRAFNSVADINENVSFLGRLKSKAEVSNFFNKIDIFITPSLREGGNISLQEAIWHSVPFATTSVPGCNILAKKFDGLVSSPKFFSDLIISNKILNHRPDLASWPRKLELYLMDSVSVEYYNIFTKIVDDQKNKCGD